LEKRIRTYSNDEVLISERRKQIIKGATGLYLKKGYDNTSTRELCETVGMSKGALYHYVGSKTDILYLVFQFALADQRKLFENMRIKTKNLGLRDALSQSIHMYFVNVDEMQDMYNFINHAIVDLPKKDRHIIYDSEKIAIEYFESLIKTESKSTIDPKFCAHQIVLAANAWAHRRWYLRKYYTIQEYIAREIEYTLAVLQTTNIV
jgi:AcrR family transcriptional regulator